MKDEFKNGDVVIEIGNKWWKYLIVGGADSKSKWYDTVRFGLREKISVFHSTRPLVKSLVHSSYVKIGRIKIPRWYDEHDK